jgi:membrane protein
VLTVAKAWDDGIFAMAAQAAYWETLSLPPLLLGLLGSLGFVTDWFGPQTLAGVQHTIVRFAGSVFNAEVVNSFIAPTVSSILNRGRADVVSVGFPIALFSGSSAVSSLVDSVTYAHEQYDIRHPVWQRVFALLIYLAALVLAVFTLPVVTLGPSLVSNALPGSWTPTVQALINTAYFPVVGLVIVTGLTTFYKIALPRSLPWLRLLPGSVLATVVFVASAAGLRFYIAVIGSTGYTYGALATPIAYLIFAFLIGFAVVLGAQLNNAIQQIWPIRPEQRRHRIQKALRIWRARTALRMARPGAPAPEHHEDPDRPGGNG